MNPAKVTEIIRCLRRDGHTFEQAAAYCRRIEHNARLNAYSPKEDAENYAEAASYCEAQVASDRLKLEHVSDLEQQHEHLLKRVLELESTIVTLTTH